jgi:hypothetical protein
MSVSCQVKEIETVLEAKQAFEQSSFLQSKMKRDANGILTEEQFTQLLNNAGTKGKFLPQNEFSFRELIDSVQREYCYSLRRYIFYKNLSLQNALEKKAADETEKQSKEFQQRTYDLLTCLQFFNKINKERTSLKPTASQTPYSWQILQRNNVPQQIESMTDLALRKDMVDDSKEKNRSASTLLGVYAFLNLTAVGLLIYILRQK